MAITADIRPDPDAPVASRLPRRLVDRNDSTIVGRWWWTLDRPLVWMMLGLIGIGLFLVSTAGPVVVARQGWSQPFHFLERHVLFIALGVPVLVLVSLLDVVQVRRLGLLMMLGTLGALALTLVIGDSRNGATRWLDLGFLSLQASEFAKPAFAVTVAWLLAHGRESHGFPGRALAVLVWMACVALLLMQPDLGQTVLITAIFFAIAFLAGLPMILVLIGGIGAAGGGVAAYFALDHVQKRVDGFLFPADGAMPFQVKHSLATIESGGLLGQGPYSGVAKWSLPDAHTDFLFSVAVEELGLVFALGIILLYGALILRGMRRLAGQQNLFVLLAGGGLLAQIAVQTTIHLATCLALIPPKGMTLPFLSYGGSSMLSLCIAGGMILALTRRAGR